MCARTTIRNLTDKVETLSILCSDQSAQATLPDTAAHCSAVNDRKPLQGYVLNVAVVSTTGGSDVSI